MPFSARVLALDVGSSSVRCSLYDGTGTPAKGTSLSLPNRFATTRDDEATLDTAFYRMSGAPR